jgi:multicomponent Na+:H+ antiporter subunit E
MRYVIGLVLSLFGIWLLWSGIYNPLLISLGGISCVFVAFVAVRLEINDNEGSLVGMAFRMIAYLPWLAWAIVKANVDVTARILSPKLRINPEMLEIEAGQKTGLGQVIYANSITLTPGTVSVDVGEGRILVHALTRESAEDLQTGEMGRKVTGLEGSG